MMVITKDQIDKVYIEMIINSLCDEIEMIIDSLCDEDTDEDDYESFFEAIQSYFRLMKIYKVLVNSEED